MLDMNRLRPSPSFALLIVGGLLFSLGGCSYLPFRHKERPAAEKPSYARLKPSSQGLLLEMKSAPDPLKLGEVRQINVTMILRNVSKKTVTLKFPTTQLIEILLRDPNTGQVVSQWSTDRSFTSEPRLLIINPGEHIDYNEPITTRELKVGKPYTLEAYLVGFDKELRATKAILAQP